MLPTPSTSHIDPSLIYEPAEDSFLLLDTLSSLSETAFLTSRFRSPSPTPLILELGTGSGVVLAFLTAHPSQLFGRADILTLGIDINGFACKATGSTVRRACAESAKREGSKPDSTASETAAVSLAALQADLTDCLRQGNVDVLVFNPPYVPTLKVPGAVALETAQDAAAGGDVSARGGGLGIGKLSCEDESSRLLSLSYAGGKDGMEVTNRLLDRLPRLLGGGRGVAYILLCKQNRPEEVVQRIKGWGERWKVGIVGRSGKQGGWEVLVVLRVWRV